ncbi:MAG: hypothetical protein GYA36_20565 [Veillonellaceae bacterium]|jgi:hypothetical protein|nr:hypothetical protein [Veillonellaceae bacterium]
MDGIVSYKHLNEILIQTLKELKRPMTAKEIDNYIFNNYKTNKIHTNAIVIGKRLQFLPHIQRLGKKKGVYVYQYV